MGKGLLTAAIALVIVALLPGLAGAKPKHKRKAKPQPVVLSIESSRPDMVSGGDALIAIDVPKPDPAGKVRVPRNGVDVASALKPLAGHARHLIGAVPGLSLGS